MNARRNRGRGLPTVVAAASVMAACAGGPPPHPPAPPPMVTSPTGEPLSGGALGSPSCREALAGWFNRTDSAPDGALGTAELAADAAALFARIDASHDGFVTPPELQAFRLPYRPARRDPREATDRPRGGSGGVPPSGRGPGGGPGQGRPPQQPRGSGDQSPREEAADPVMSADANLDFRVSRDEFLRHVEETAGTLDSDHDGRLDRGEVQALCRSPD